MHHRSRLLIGVAVVMGFVAPMGALAFSGGPAMAAPIIKAPMAYTCSGGDLQTGTFVTIPSGTYASISVTGACRPESHSVITVIGDINVAPGAVFDAQTFPSTITVGHDVTAGPGSLLGLGCLPNPPGHTTGHPCIEANGNATIFSSTIKIEGNIAAWNASAVLLNGITVNGNVTLTGSDGTATETARATALPWSIKTNTIGGNLIVSNMTPIWIGVLDNNVGGNVALINIHITDGLSPNNDPMPTIFVASNTIGQNLVCWELGPYLSGGFPGEFNVVGGHSFGQCADLRDQ